MADFERGSQRATLHPQFQGDVRAGGPGANAVVPERVLASWQRSEAYGVSHDAIEPTFSSGFEDDSLLYESGRHVLADLRRTLINEPVSLMVTDADGVVLLRQGDDRDLQRSLDADHLAPGFGYSERIAGTNGLGLALADQAPTLVRADQHYARSLCRYNCAAAPIYNPRTGTMAGCINLTTWALSPSELLLPLAQSAANNTTALMYARTGGLPGPLLSRSNMFKVQVGSLDDDPRPSPSDWSRLVDEASRALSTRSLVLAVGEPGTGRRTLLAQALGRTRRLPRIVIGGLPETDDLDAWRSSWAAELGRPHAAIIALDVDAMPTWAAPHLCDLLVRSEHADTLAAPTVVCMTATRYEDIPPSLARLVDTIIEIPPLRDRIGDVLPLARSIARRVRSRDVSFTSAAQHALCNYTWPGNVVELRQIIADAARRTNMIDVHHLPPDFFTISTHRLSRIKTAERDEIVRVLGEANGTMAAAATRLGMSRATLYRKVQQFGIQVQRNSR